MSEVNFCAECGEVLPNYWPKGFCNRCALDDMLASRQEGRGFRWHDEPRSSFGNEPSDTSGEQPNEASSRFGDYQLLEEIARGGMGVVYRARQVSLNRTVALKMILSGQFASKQEVLRFRAEAEAAANLRHPNIVAIYETGETEGRHYFSMDYVRGRNLAEIAMEGPLPAKRTAHYAKIVAEAIQYAHEQGVLHRDLKPSNILIDENDDPRITDFGLAKLGHLDFGLTVTGQLLGSPNFMPPEQAAGKTGKKGPANDVYGLGAIIYHLLTGRPPFRAETIEDLLRQLREAAPMAPRLLNASVPRDLETICLKCLEKEPAKRYQSARELAEDLGRFLRDEPIQARPINPSEKIWRWCRRKPVVASLTVLLLVVAAAGIAGILWKNEELESNLYFNRVALAHRESTAEPANVKEAERLLDECAPRFQNWEWHYLKRRRYSEPLVLPDLESRGIHSVSFSSDGRYLASGAGDGRIRIWDLAAAKVLRTLPGHTGFVASVAFSPANPALIASGGSDRKLVLWNWRTGEAVRSWPAETVLANGMSYAVAFSRDGKRLAAPAERGEVIVRDTTTGEELFTLRGHEAVAQCISFSPNGRWVATGSSGGIVRLWHATGGNLVKTMGVSSPPVSGVAFSRDGRRLAATHVNGLVEVWDTEKYHAISSFYIGNSLTAGMASHPDSERLFTGGFDRLVTISEPRTRRQLLVFRELSRGCACLALSADGNRLAAGSVDGSIHVWDATPLDGSETSSLLSLDYPGDVYSLDIAPNGESIAVGGTQVRDSPGGKSAEVQAWSTPGFLKPLRLPGHSILVFGLAYDPTGRLLASCGDDKTAPLKVWDLQLGREAFPIESFEGNQVLFSASFSKDGKWLAAAGRDRKIKIWEGATGRKVGVVGRHVDEITKLTFSPNGKYLASIGNDGVVNLWDATGLDKEQEPLRVFAGQCEDFADLIAFTPDSSRLAAISSDDVVTINDVDGDKKALFPVGRSHRPLAIAFSPDGRWVATGGKDCSVKVWDLQTKALLRLFKGHVDQVTRLLFFQRPEGLCLASASRDGTVNLWDLAQIK